MSDDLIIGVDLDGVLFNLVDNCRDAFLEHGYINKGQYAMAMDRYNFWTKWQMEASEFWEHFAHLVNTGDLFWNPDYLYGDPVDILLGLCEYGKIYLVTARDIPGCAINARSATHHWLYSALGPVPWSGVIISSDKTCIGADIFFEDSTSNMLKLLDAGTLPVAIDQPWNQDWTGDRIDSFDQALDYVVKEIIDPRASAATVGA